MKNLKKINYQELDENSIKIIGEEWMLITAGSLEKGFNMMTAAWGGLGFLWKKPVCFTFVRPQRYTFEFTEKEEFFTLSFFEKKYKPILNLMGKVSGKDYDKINNSGLTSFATDNNSVGFEEARLIIECRKIYSTVLQEKDFLDKDIIKVNYPNKDFHTMYVGEILNIWINNG